MSVQILIIQKFPDIVNLQNLRGETPIHLACMFHLRESVNLLTRLPRYVNFNLKTGKGQDLLCCTISNPGHTANTIVQYLLNIGFEWETERAIEYARSLGRDSIVRMIRRAVLIGEVIPHGELRYSGLQVSDVSERIQSMMSRSDFDSFACRRCIGAGFGGRGYDDEAFESGRLFICGDIVGFCPSERPIPELKESGDRGRNGGKGKFLSWHKQTILFVDRGMTVSHDTCIALGTVERTYIFFSFVWTDEPYLKLQNLLIRSKEEKKEMEKEKKDGEEEEEEGKKKEKEEEKEGRGEDEEEKKKEKREGEKEIEANFVDLQTERPSTCHVAELTSRYRLLHNSLVLQGGFDNYCFSISGARTRLIDPNLFSPLKSLFGFKQEQESDEKSPRLIHSGLCVPDSILCSGYYRQRSDAWLQFSGGKRKKETSSTDYFAKLALAAKSLCDDQILKDVTRVQPGNPLFDVNHQIHQIHPDLPGVGQPSDDGLHLPGVACLNLLLSMYALRNPRTGYVQSMNSIASVILIVTEGDIEAAFWIFCGLIEDSLPDYHANIELLMIDSDILNLLIELTFPNLAGWWTQIEFPRMLLQHSVISPWFYTLFAHAEFSPPFETVMWIYDNIFLQGPAIMFPIALSVFSLCEEKLLQIVDESDAKKEIQKCSLSLCNSATFAKRVDCLCAMLDQKGISAKSLRQRAFFDAYPTQFQVFFSFFLFCSFSFIFLLSSSLFLPSLSLSSLSPFFGPSHINFFLFFSQF